MHRLKDYLLYLLILFTYLLVLVGLVADEMNRQWDVSVPDSTLAAYVDDALAPLLNGAKKDDKPVTLASSTSAAAADVKHLAPGEERTRRHTMPTIPSCSELYVSTKEVHRSSPCFKSQYSVCFGPRSSFAITGLDPPHRIILPHNADAFQTPQDRTRLAITCSHLGFVLLVCFFTLRLLLCLLYFV